MTLLTNPIFFEKVKKISQFSRKLICQQINWTHICSKLTRKIFPCSRFQYLHCWLWRCVCPLQRCNQNIVKYKIKLFAKMVNGWKLPINNFSIYLALLALNNLNNLQDPETFSLLKTAKRLRCHHLMSQKLKKKNMKKKLSAYLDSAQH